MPVSKKIAKEVEDEKSGIREFLVEKKHNEEPYYNAGEIVKELRLKHLDVADVKKYLFDLSVDPVYSIERMEYKKIYYYKHR